MGSTEFQKELISYLEDENNKLRNKVTYMKENLERVLTRDSSKVVLENVVEEVLNVCTAMTDEIEDLYEHFSAASAALCTVLKRKSQMVQLTKKLSELQAVEQLDPELEPAEANNMACFAKRLSDGKNNKRGTAKVSPMIKGHVILTAPRIHLNRVNQDASIRHRIVSEPPDLSPVIEASPATPPRNQRHLFFREIQIPLQRLNINSDGQVINRNSEESPRTTVIKKQTKVPTSRSGSRSSESDAQRNRETLELIHPIEEENDEVAGEEEKENLSGVSEVDRANDSLIREDNSQVLEDDKTEEPYSPSTLVHESDIDKNKSSNSPEAVDPLEGPSWLLDERPNRRRSSAKSSSFNFVNVRRKRNPFFSAGDSDAESVENPTSEKKLDSVDEQEEVDESEKGEETSKDDKIDKSDGLVNDSTNIENMEVTEHLPVNNIDLSDMEMTECLPVVHPETTNPANKSLAGKCCVDSSDMEMTECLPVVCQETIIRANSLPAVEKPTSSILESSLEINSTVLQPSEPTSMEIAERKCIEESSEEDEPNNLSNISILTAEGPKSEHSTSVLENSNDRRNTLELGSLELVLEKIDSPKNTPEKNSSYTKNKNSTKGMSPEARSPNLNSPEPKKEEPNNLSLTPGRPKRGAALRCMEQKVWIASTPEDKKNKNRNKCTKNDNQQHNPSSTNHNKNKCKRKQNKDSPKIKEEEANVDSESESEISTSASPKRKKSVKSKIPNEETNQTINQSNQQTSSRPTDADSKNKRKGAPTCTSTVELSMNESSRIGDQTGSINGSCIAEEEGRKRRRAAPGSLKEPSLNSKLRRNQS